VAAPEPLQEAPGQLPCVGDADKVAVVGEVLVELGIGEGGEVSNPHPTLGVCFETGGSHCGLPHWSCACGVTVY
jgi:hypothetical protein